MFGTILWIAVIGALAVAAVSLLIAILNDGSSTY